jgi:hypothetical protein
MFWPFLLAASIAISLIQLGALSVWVAVLSLCIKVLLLVLIAVVLLYAWQRYRGASR